MYILAASSCQLLESLYVKISILDTQYTQVHMYVGSIVDMPTTATSTFGFILTSVSYQNNNGFQYDYHWDVMKNKLFLNPVFI